MTLKKRRVAVVQKGRSRDSERDLYSHSTPKHPRDPRDRDRETERQRDRQPPTTRAFRKANFQNSGFLKSASVHVPYRFSF